MQEAIAAGFRQEGDSDEDFVRRVLEKLAAPAVVAVTNASGEALKEARTALLEAAGSATTINSKVAEACIWNGGFALALLPVAALGQNERQSEGPNPHPVQDVPSVIAGAHQGSVARCQPRKGL